LKQVLDSILLIISPLVPLEFLRGQYSSRVANWLLVKAGTGEVGIIGLRRMLHSSPLLLVRIRGVVAGLRIQVERVEVVEQIGIIVLLLLLVCVV